MQSLARYKTEKFKGPFFNYTSPTAFCLNTGINPYTYQHQIFDLIEKKKSKRIIITKPRQIGVSLALQNLSNWFAVYNIAPTGAFMDTKVIVVSRDDASSKKFIEDVKRQIELSPYLQSQLKKGKAQNTTVVNFLNGSIKCFPPTGRIRGNSADLVIVDEAAFVDDKIYKEAILPTVTKTDGIIILSSTPNGQKGYFYELFDPNDLHSSHQYYRLWYHWKMCEDPVQLRIINDELKNARRTGNMKSFMQEYEAMFTVDQSAFFDDVDIEKSAKQDLPIEYEWKKTPCAIGLDYGMTTAATVIT